MMREKTKQTSWILSKRSHNKLAVWGFDCRLHKDDKEDDTLKAEELGEGVDEQVDDEEAILDGQHRLVACKWEFHAPTEKLASGQRRYNSKSMEFVQLSGLRSSRCGPLLWLT